MPAQNLLEIRQGVLSKNDHLASRLRQRFEQAGVFVVNLMSSPGAGKTRLLEETLRRMAPRYRVAALVGDLATDNDAQRLARSGAPVRQIETGDLCHLEAHLVERNLDGWDLEGIDFLFIENVGNLVCPTGYDLGEAERVVLLAVTEGEDKPLKYPGTFVAADCAVLTKADLADAVEFDRAAAEANIALVNPDITLLFTSAKTGAGMDEWIAWLEQCRVGSGSR
jgi:hydrogenase nickel incorporation protein HypB